MFDGVVSWTSVVSARPCRDSWSLDNLVSVVVAVSGSFPALAHAYVLDEEVLRVFGVVLNRRSYYLSVVSDVDS